MPRPQGPVDVPRVEALDPLPVAFEVKAWRKPAAERMSAQTTSPAFARMAAHYLRLAAIGQHVWRVTAAPRRQRSDGNVGSSQSFDLPTFLLTLIAVVAGACFLLGWTCARRHAPVGDAPEQGNAGGRGNAGQQEGNPAGPEPPAEAAPNRAEAPPAADARVPEPEEDWGIPARFDAGECAECGRPIRRGQYILRAPGLAGNRWKHSVCPFNAPPPPRTRTVGVQGPVHYTWYAADQRFKASNHGFTRGGEVHVEQQRPAR